MIKFYLLFFQLQFGFVALVSSMRLINGIVKAFYGRAATIIENKNKHRSFNEMIQWRRNREKIERLQRNKVSISFLN